MDVYVDGIVACHHRHDWVRPALQHEFEPNSVEQSFSLAFSLSIFFWVFLCRSFVLTSLVNLVWKITPFTTQIFEFFIATTFIYESLRDLLVPLHLLGDSRSSTAYAGFVLGMGTFVICWTCHFAETWNLLPPSLKSVLASYNMLLAITIMTGLSYLPGIDQSPSSSTGTSTGTHSAGLERVQVEVPWNWQPSDTDHRTGWLINPLEGITVAGIFGALFPAFMLYLLFFIDHNISSILTQAPQYNLTKPPAYHWDFFVLGLTIIPWYVYRYLTVLYYLRKNFEHAPCTFLTLRLRFRYCHLPVSS